MARRGDGLVALICPNCDHATTGMLGDRCPLCEAEMVADTELASQEKSTVGLEGGREEHPELAGVSALGLDDDSLDSETESIYDIRDAELNDYQDDEWS
jgi:hypothetical protein